MKSFSNKPNSLSFAICSFIHKTRVALNISQDYMATVLDMTQSSYSKREIGYSEFKLSQIEIIAGEFKMPLPEFFLRAFCSEQSVKEAVAAYIEGLAPKEAEKMRHRLKSEYLHSSNIMLMTLLLLEGIKA